MKYFSMGLVIFISLNFIGASCNPVLRPDPNPSAINSGYNSLELVSDYQRVGVGSLTRLEGEVPDNKSLKVRLIQSGVVNVVSHICNIDWSMTYSKSGWLDIPLKELIGEKYTKSCILTITVHPVLMGQQQNPQVVFGYRGQVYLKVIPENDLPAHINDYSGILAIQYRLNSFAQLPLISIDLNKSKEGVYRIEGCGKHIEDEYAGEQELIIDINPLLVEQDCIYQGAIVPLDQDKDYVFSIMVQRFSNNYNHLPFPEITDKINSDETVSFTEVDDKIVNENKDVDVGDAKQIRIYTVKGRYVFCEKGVVLWKCQR